MNAPLHTFGAFGSTGSIVAALVIGLAFGWFLERGGLGNARKLAGQFYLTDLTVFKVLFTALGTAMLGVFWLARAGLLEPRLLEVPATFVAPVAVGGVVFGLGFVLGGLCPGTSCVSASSGRIDGLLVMAGMFLGVLAFMELHPLLEAFHNATGRGLDTLPSLLSARPGMAVAIVTATAILGFAGAERIAGSPSAGPVRGALGGAALVLGLGAALPANSDVAWPGDAVAGREIESLDLARALRAGETDLTLVDVRSPEAFDDFHLPRARNVPLHRLGRVGSEPDGPIVVYGFDTRDGERGRILLERNGVEGIRVLQGGAVGWLRAVMLPTLPPDADLAERRSFERIAELSRYFGGTPRAGSERGDGSGGDLDMEAILAQARRASCGW